jgi:16S rRNA (cytidine1402-2'-O)-methyltransferase
MIDSNEDVNIGELYLVPTPIGNLGDMTLRAIEVLKEVDLIAAEDTRTSRRLLEHFGITNRLKSYHDFSSDSSRRKLLTELSTGNSVALISDAGTPGISDPAYRLVNESLKIGVKVIPLPGATSIIPALVGSGLPCDAFKFVGFLPRKKGRVTAIEQMIDSNETSIFMESPHRLLASLELLKDRAPDRLLCVAREISKIHEEFLRGTVIEIHDHFIEHNPRGEFVLVLEGQKAGKKRMQKLSGQTDLLGF